MAFHETNNSNNEFVKWELKGKFITTSGIVQETISICDSAQLPFNPCVAFDGTNYFITWTQYSNYSLMGQFFTKSGTPIGEPSVIFGPSNNKVPIGGIGFGGNHYLAVATKLDSNFSDGDVYGRFVQPVTGVNEEKNQIPNKYALLPNYPNPFNPDTQIKFSIPNSHFVQLKIYNLLGIEVVTLVNEVKPQGVYTINWNADCFPSGVYFCTMKAGQFTQIRKLILLR